MAMKNKFETIILVTDSDQANYACQLYDQAIKDRNSTLILASEEVALDKRKYRLKSLKHYQELLKIDYSQVRQEAYELFYSLAEREVYPGACLRKLTAYKGVSLWDLSANFVFLHLIPLLYYLKIAEAVLNFQKPSQLYIIHSNGGEGEILEQVFCLLCKKNQIKFTLKYLSKKRFLWLKSRLKKLHNSGKRIKRLGISLYLFSLNLVKSRKLKRKYKLIFFTPTERFFLSMLPIIEKYKTSDRLVINTYFFESADKQLRNRKIPYLDFYGFKLYSLMRHTKSDLNRVKLAIQEPAFYKSIYYDNFCIGELLIGVFEELFDEHFSERIREVDIIRKIVLSFTPEVVVAADCSANITSIAKSLPVSSLAIQSMHPEDFILFGPVLADMVTVDGNSWKEYLLKHNVPEEKISVIGSLRYDFLQNRIKRDKVISLAKKAKEAKKRVVFATNYSSLTQGTIRYQNLEKIEGICRAMNGIKGAHLIMKLHPYEDNFNLYRSIAKKVGLKDYTLLRDVEISQLLNNCDLLVTHISAVGYEAVLMDKNVVILKFDSDFRSDDLWNFKRYNAVMFAEKATEIEDCIRSVLFDPQTKSLLKKNRIGYINDHTYKLEENASLRAKEVIDKFCTNYD